MAEEIKCLFDPIQQAREYVWDAWDSIKTEEKKTMALRALQLDPLCCDAYNILALYAKSNKKRLEFYKKGLESFLERTNQTEFDEYIGNFWSIQFRPYLRSIYGYGTALWDENLTTDAISQFQYLLTLDETDHMEARVKLMYWFASSKQYMEATEELLFFPKNSYHYIFGKLFIELQINNNYSGVIKAYERATETNHIIIDLITGKMKEPEQYPESYKQGSKEQALCYYHQISSEWKDSRKKLRAVVMK
ncbi:hypothetical protein K7J14_15995 [Treponema zuelzerae]|uniref:Tetratricopeptide repeat protein n=1 Tax=Teretinema zuelzerae TaxID=156 RepID=A0AAE3EF56_9SPIR|nr:hypothetical protein [Teretinema zuelzerae]MCD1653107.1 hypothetical protein [Teretinema zuelzerae]MCD1656196.1 hypothetical protein [Teretinema zuelzerae]